MSDELFLGESNVTSPDLLSLETLRENHFTLLPACTLVCPICGVPCKLNALRQFYSWNCSCQRNL